MKKLALVLAATALIAFLAYSQALQFDFVYDDNDAVVNNQWIRSWSDIPAIFSNSVWGFAEDTPEVHYYRPVHYLIYLFVFQFFGLDPSGFHLASLLLHCLNTVLVFLLGLRILDPAGLEAGNETSAIRGLDTPAVYIPSFLAAVVFALHPINSEAVCWIGCIPELAYTAATLAALYFYVSADRRIGRWLVALTCFAVGLLSKETAVVFLLLAAAWDILIVRRSLRQALYRSLPFIAVISVYLVIRYHAVGLLPRVSFSAADLPAAFLNIWPLFGRYVAKLIVPTDLSVIYQLDPARSLLEIRVLIPLILCVLGGWALWRFRSDRRLLFLSFWTVAPLLPVLYSPAVSIGGFADRYLYLPACGFSLLIAHLASRALSIQNLSRHRYRWAWVGTVLLAVVLATATLYRSGVWRNDVTLFEDAARKTPGSPEVWNNLGNAHWKFKSFPDAAHAYEEALRLRPDHVESILNLASIYDRTGRTGEAIKLYEQFLDLAPDRYEIHKRRVRIRLHRPPEPERNE